MKRTLTELCPASCQLSVVLTKKRIRTGLQIINKLRKHTVVNLGPFFCPEGFVLRV